MEHGVSQEKSRDNDPYGLSRKHPTAGKFVVDSFTGYIVSAVRASFRVFIYLLLTVTTLGRPGV